MIHRVEMEWAGRILSLESGRVARQADGAVLVRYADTVVLATVVQSKEPREDVDFLPLTVEFRERMYAAGKIPGGFFKREGKPSDMEVLASRMIGPFSRKDTATKFRLWSQCFPPTRRTTRTFLASSEHRLPSPSRPSRSPK